MRPDDDLALLLERCGESPAAVSASTPALLPLRSRLLSRVRRAAESARAFGTLRRHQLVAEPIAAGVLLHRLHVAAGAWALRPGEPLRAARVDIAAGAAWTPDPGGEALRREWLVIAGRALIDGDALDEGSYRVAEDAAGASVRVQSSLGATLYLREAPGAAAGGSAALVQHEHDSLWHDFAPGIRRRLLWQQGTQAAMLYRVQAGASVARHGHGHDEECLMLDGELFLDDVLLRGGEYQLAPAGTTHGGVSTDTGALLYAHGDLDLQLLPG